MFKVGPVRNIEKVQAFLRKVPHGTKKAAILAILVYLVGNKEHGFRHDNPYKQTTRKKVYGKQWESDAQRRYVMAAIRSGEIVLGRRSPNPTDASKGYGYKLTNGGYGGRITNPAPGAYWSRMWGGWKNWRTATEVIDNNIKGALRSATAKVNAVLRSLR